jgi:hypothetical protein
MTPEDQCLLRRTVETLIAFEVEKRLAQRPAVTYEHPKLQALTADLRRLRVEFDQRLFRIAVTAALDKLIATAGQDAPGIDPWIVIPRMTAEVMGEYGQS